MVRRIWLLAYCFGLFTATFSITIFFLAHYPYDWTYAVGEAFVQLSHNGSDPFELREPWYALAFVIFILSAIIALGTFGNNFINYPPRTRDNRLLEKVLLTLVGFSPFMVLGRSGLFLAIFANSGPEYWPAGVENFDSLQLFLGITVEQRILSTILSVSYLITTFVLAYRLGHLSGIVSVFSKITSPRLPNAWASRTTRVLTKTVNYMPANNDSSVLTNRVSIGYCLVFFIGFFTLNLSTILNPMFSWSGATIIALNKLIVGMTPIFDILEIWYAIGLGIYILGSISLIGIFLFLKLKHTARSVSTPISRYEFFRLIIIGLSPILFLHSARLLINTIPQIDPEYDRQIQNMIINGITSWHFRASPLEARAHTLEIESEIVIASYLLLLFSSFGLRVIKRILVVRSKP